MSVQAFGLCYQGSKNGICKELFDYMPNGERFIDLFGGGGAMSHYAYLTQRYKEVCYNEFNEDLVEVIRQVTTATLPPLRWISRQEFKNPYCPYFFKLLYSFGCNLQDYFCAIEKENLYHELYEIIIEKKYNNALSCLLKEKDREGFEYLYYLNDYYSRRKLVSELLNLTVNDISISPVARYLRMQNMCNINLTITNSSYKNYVYKEGDVVYCDPPYENTRQEGYLTVFNSKKFYEWALSREYSVYISSYKLPADFHLVAEIKKPNLADRNNKVTIERLYCNKKVKTYKQLFFNFDC